MSKPTAKQALNRLTRQKHNAFASDDLISELNNSLNSSNDRTIAILFGALVEDTLRAAITRRLRELSPDDDARIFEDYGPLTTFSAKIIVGYAMDVINRRQHADLEHIKDLRNAFAHVAIGLSFSDKEVHDVCRLLKLADASKLPSAGHSARGIFILSCTILIYQLSGNLQNIYLGTMPIGDLIASDPHSFED